MQRNLESIKRFLSNKNTVTILGVVAGVLVLYIGYNWRVEQAVTPITIPYAKEELTSRSLITSDLIGYMEVPGTVVRKSPNILTKSGQVIDRFVAYGVTIPQNSFFYSSSVMTKDKIPTVAFSNIEDGYTIFSLSVDLHTTYGNSIVPGNYIDLYAKAKDDSRKIIFGKLIESIKVLDVRDNKGNSVFESSKEEKTPAELLFAVPDDMYLLLMKAGYLKVEIVPVPRNASYTDNKNETKVTSDYIENFILSKSAQLEDDLNNTLPEDEDNTSGQNNSNNNSNNYNSTN